MSSRRRLLLVLPVALLSVLLDACTTVSSRIDQHQAVFAAATPEQQQLMRAGKVAEGFTPEMVRIAFGEPDKVVPSLESPGTPALWVYGQEQERPGHSATMAALHSPDTAVNASPTLQARNQAADQRRAEANSIARDPSYRSTTAQSQPHALTAEQQRLKQREDSRLYAAYTRQTGSRPTTVRFFEGKVVQVL